MSYKVRPKRSPIPSKVPQPGDLEIGELAINVADKKLYTKDASNVIVQVSTVDYNDLANTPALADVATSGSYSDLSDTPDFSSFTGNIIPSANVTYSLGDATHQWKDLWVSNNTIYINSIPLSIDNTGNLLVNGSPVTGSGSSFSGDYNDLTNTPTIPSIGNVLFENSTLYTSNWSSISINPSNNFANYSYITVPNFEDGGETLTIANKFGFSNGIDITTETGTFNFKGTNLTLPAGGDILDSNGASVLGGSSVTNEITNTDGSNTYSVSVGTDGIVSMTTARGGIEFGAMPEVGSPQHLHIMRPAGQESSTDLYFGDDYNYVKLPGLYGVNSQGVEIGSSYNSGNVSIWKFDTAGHLVPGSDILQDIGTPTNRVRHIYVGPGSITVGNSVITESNTGKLVLPGLTRATSAYVDEVDDTGDQFYTFTNTAVAVDYTIYQAILNNTDATGYADYTVNLDDDGYIDEIQVNGQGSYTDAESVQNRNNDMYVYAGVGSASDRPINPNDWVQVPFRPRMKANDVEYEFSTGGGGNADIGDLSFENNTMFAMDDEENATGFINLDNGENQALIGTNNEMPLIISVNENNSAKNWTFGTDGIITLPEGGDIVDSNGSSVLGGGSGSNLPSDQAGFLQNDGNGNLTWSTTTADLGNMRLASWGYPGNNPLRITHATRGESILLQTSDDPDSGNEARTSIRWHIRNEPDGNEGSRYSQIDVQNDGVWIKNADWSGANGDWYWHFDTNGNLVLPSNGDIKDSNGNSVLGSAGNSTKTWTNPNENTWRIEEYAGGWAGGYNYPSASISYTVVESQTDVNYFAIDTAAFPTEWQAIQWGIDFALNGQTIGYGGYGFVSGSIYNVSLQSNVSYNVGDVITINYRDQNQNPEPAVWWDAANSTNGNENFRGAIIEYHAYCDNGGTVIGKIIIAADDENAVTHTEAMSGGSNLSEYELWYAPSYGQLAVRRVGTDASNSDDQIWIQWTSKIFYGSEYYC